MNGNLMALRGVEKRLSERNGEFALFALFLPAESGNRWDLVVSAPWARRDDRTVLECVSNEMSASVDRDDPVIGRIVVVETWHPDVQEINARVDVEHDWFAIANEEHFGYVAERGFIVTSKDYWRFIKRLFPVNTDFSFSRDIRNGDFCIRISRQLVDDAEGRNKRWQRILRIPEELLTDYLYPAMTHARQHHVRQVAERGLVDFVLRECDAPDHSAPRGDDWVVTPEDLQREAVVAN